MIHIKIPGIYPDGFNLAYVYCNPKEAVPVKNAKNYLKADCKACANEKLKELISEGKHEKVFLLRNRFKIS